MPVIKASSTTNENVRSQLALRVFLKADATKKQGLNVQKKIDKIPHVARTQYVSKTQGLNVLRDEVGKGPLRNGLGQLKRQPPPALDQRLPGRSRQPGLDPGRDQADRGQRQAEADQPGDRQASTTRQQLAEQIRTVTNAVKIILSVIAVLLLVASLMLVANTIRLSIYARRREVEVMRLVGATNWFIRWPFVIEGLIVGLAGAALAVGILWVGKVTIIDPLKRELRPDRQLLDRRLHDLDRAAGRLGGRRLRAGQRDHAAPLPPRLIRPSAARGRRP